jgi:hypothetical protein
LVVGAIRVLAGGQPALIQSGKAVCVATGTALNVVAITGPGEGSH